MFIPKQFLATDSGEIIAFMQQFSFATIITAKDQLPVATHLPFVVSERADKVILTSHFAKANEQWEQLTDHPILVIFTEPHAYISPTHYDSPQSVPTWNYVSVHAYGQGRLLTDTAQTMKVLEATIHTYEASYRQQWDNISEDYKLKMIKGIIAFEIEVTDLQAKKKLSQNKTATEQQRIINTLSDSDKDHERQIAVYMQNHQ